MNNLNINSNVMSIDSFLKDVNELLGYNFNDTPEVREVLNDELNKKGRLYQKVVSAKRKTKMAQLRKERKLTSGETLAYVWLNENDWSPVKVHNSKGMPDFKCSNNRWVEAKSIHRKQISIELLQLKSWQELINKGDTVFLMFYDIIDNLVSMPLNLSMLSLDKLISSIKQMVVI